MCVLNLVDESMVDAIDRLALLTGRPDVPDYKRARGYSYEPDKFAAAGLTPAALRRGMPAGVAESPIQMEGRVQAMHEIDGPDSGLLRDRGRGAAHPCRRVPADGQSPELHRSVALEPAVHEVHRVLLRREPDQAVVPGARLGHAKLDAAAGAGARSRGSHGHAGSQLPGATSPAVGGEPRSASPGCVPAQPGLRLAGLGRDRVPGPASGPAVADVVRDRGIAEPSRDLRRRADWRRAVWRRAALCSARAAAVPPRRRDEKPRSRPRSALTV